MRPWLVVVALAAVACQPAGNPGAAGPTTPAAPESEPRLGAPAAGGVPQSLDALLDRTDREARRWQDEPRLVQVVVALDEQGHWTAADASYIAADADRILTLTAEGQGLAEQLVSLATLQLQPVTAVGMEQLPELPDDVLDPVQLVEACATDVPAVEVAYTTGAPATWDGTAWTVPPEWTSLIATGEDAVSVDPTGGDGCEEA